MFDYYDSREEYPITYDDIEDALFYVNEMEEMECRNDYYRYAEMEY